MLNVPTREDLAHSVNLASRILKKSIQASATDRKASKRDEDLRALCKAHMELVGTLDDYVADIYPVFDEIEREYRENGCQIVLFDGKFVLVDRNANALVSGPTLRDLAINYLLWHTDWESQEDLEEAAQEEDSMDEEASGGEE